MSLAQQAIGEVAAAHEFFNRSTRGLTEAQSAYAPAEGMMTAAAMVAHTAQTIEWFVEGAFRPEGFDMDFEGAAAKTNACTSLADAKAWFEKAVASAKEVLATKSDADLLAPLPEGPIMGGLPRMAIIGAITDHTAHHRGALTVYARLNQIVPPMPYMEM
ncbi:MAG: DinB family protein [Bryobacterales bacterium]|nr:DinB family protein [Bryobacterales bacterium]